jgi:hypothetical protein
LHQRRTFVVLAGASSVYCGCIIQKITLLNATIKVYLFLF